MERKSAARRRRVPRAVACAVSACLLAVASAAAQGGWTAERRGLAGKDLNAVYFADSKRGWVAGDEGVVLRTDDGGRTWQQQPTGVPDGVNDIYFRDKEDGYLLAANRVLTTEDGGRTWRPSARFAPADFNGATPELYSVRFTSKKRGWIAGSLSRGDRVLDSLLLRTDDGGASWQRVSAPVRVELLHLDFRGEKRGWIVGDRGTILRTSDGGDTWRQQRVNTTATLYHVDFEDDETGWAVGERSTILRTTDGGATWIAVEVPVLGPRATLLSVAFANKEEGWIVGRNGTILRSSDGGRTWVRQESGTKQHIYALHVRDKRAWAVGGDGQVLSYER
ncbi:MAG TPA: YCF48-related protein [Pyrinomonadaceae bacterium]|nr:YCF48-related protein [Pyrinomonadaceae bacterium]